MLYHIDTDERTAGGHTVTVYSMARHDIASEAEIWPSHGFNCLKWKARGHDLLYAAPDWADKPLPTKSGVPILFPFPNRIADGNYRFGGREYRLPKNDSQSRNAIHGFAVRAPWNVFGYRADADHAVIHADFDIDSCASEASDLWPGSAMLSVQYRLDADSLRMTFTVKNRGAGPFPYGLGIHPYFQLPGVTDVGRMQLTMPARSLWELNDCIPTGRKTAVPDGLNFNRPKRILDATLDHVYGDLGELAHDGNGLVLRAELTAEDADGTLEVWTSPEFREMVLFTPPHRRALCIEPYTCVTDAINLADRGVDSGWSTLGDMNHQVNLEIAFRFRTRSVR